MAGRDARASSDPRAGQRNWGDDAYSLTGDGSIGWIRSGTVEGQHTGVAAGRQLTLPTGRRHSVAVLRQVNVRFT